MCKEAFTTVTALLCSSPVLSAPDFTVPFKFEVDSSGAGAVLLREDSASIDHPVCYFSKKFSAAQRKYSTIEKEALACIGHLWFRTSIWKSVAKKGRDNIVAEALSRMP